MVIGEERLELGAEQEGLVVQRVIQRLDADAVPGDEEDVRSGIPDGEGEHATQTRDAVLAELLVGVNYDLGVAGGSEAMSAGQQLLPKLREIVDLAVEDDPDRAVLIGHRLNRRFQVDD